jgi:hypothetical protein
MEKFPYMFMKIMWMELCKIEFVAERELTFLQFAVGNSTKI